MALTYSGSQQGTVGSLAPVTDVNGNAGQYLVPAVQVTDASGNPTPISNATRPYGSTVVGSTSGNVAAASAVATLPAVSGKTNYIEGFTITGAGATGASNVVATLTGLLGGTNSYIVTAPAGVTTAIQALTVVFDTARPASAANTAIVVTLPSLGAGNTHACVNAWGFVV
jgi:hypothetical protein